MFYLCFTDAGAWHLQRSHGRMVIWRSLLGGIQQRKGAVSWDEQHAGKSSHSTSWLSNAHY